jgi:tetratricopeptide (TPR) repeat protein
MKKDLQKSFLCLITIITVISLTGCVKLALRSSHSVVANLTHSIFEECDPRLAELSIPTELKILEGILKNDPENKQLLTSLCMGFTGYALLFIEEDDPEWASSLYLRARNYGFMALGEKAQSLITKSANKETIDNVLKGIDKSDVDPLFWTTMSWNAWINLNLDKPTALSQIGTAEACLKRMLEIKPDFLYGSPYVLMGTIHAAKPKMLGGNANTARDYFHKAMELSKGEFLLVHYFYAKYYTVMAQDKRLFLQLISHAEETPPEISKEVCLINAVMKQKLLRLKKNIDELFF